MKGFLRTVFIYCLILAAVTLAVNAVYMRRDRSDKYGTDKYASMPQRIDVCNFGSSHGLNAFCYDALEEEGLGCFNFAMTSQFLSYDLRLLEQYGDRLSDDAVVFIPVSYFSLFGRPEETYDEFEGKNRRYYRILPADRIKSYDPVMDLYVNHLPSLVAASNLFPVLLGRSAPADTRWSTSIDPARAGAAARSAAGRHLEENKLDETGKRIFNEEEAEALEEMIALCKARGVKPVMLTTPYLAEYNEAVSEEDPAFKETFNEVMARICRETGGVFLDYAEDERFTGRYDLFGDADHLNREGAMIFTDILMKEATGAGGSS